MKKKIFQKILFVVGMLTFINGYTDENDNDYVNCDDYKSTFQGHSAPKDKINKGYNHPARIDVRNSWDYFISASYIYWQPRQEGLELAREFFSSEDAEWDFSWNAKLIEMDFDYHSGFKVGTGANFERDDWSLEFEYTRLYTTDHRSRTLSNNPEVLENHYLDALWVESQGTIIGIFEGYHAKGRWKLHFNILDGILARSHYVGTKLSFKPYIGLRAGWIHQRYRTNYTYLYEPITEEYYDIFFRSRCKSQSWLLGARVGLDTNWHFGEGFRLFGNTAASLFYQRFKTNVNLIRDENEAVLAFKDNGIKEKEGYFNPNFEIALGLGWGSYFCDDNWHIDLLAAYEFHIFWDQNMMRKLSDYLLLTADPTPGDLVLHGLTISLRLDF